MLGRNEIRIWGESEDKEEFYNLLMEREDIVIRRGLAEAIGAPLIINMISGLLNIFKILRDFLKGKREKNLKIGITLSDGRIMTITSQDFQELNIIIDEYSQKKPN